MSLSLQICQIIETAAQPYINQHWPDLGDRDQFHDRLDDYLYEQAKTNPLLKEAYTMLDVVDRCAVVDHIVGKWVL